MSTKTYEYNNQKMKFNFKTFSELFSKEARRNKMNLGTFEEELAKELNVSKDAVHSWRCKINSPLNIELIKELALKLQASDFSILLTNKEYKTQTSLNNLQKLSVKRIYDSIIDFLEYFKKTNGFNDLWFDLTCNVNHREGKLYDIALEKIDYLYLFFEKEYPFLKNTKIYEELEKFEEKDLFEIFEDKLTYGYRYEAIVDGNPTTQDDYYKALNKLKAIINKYM